MKLIYGTTVARKKVRAGREGKVGEENTCKFNKHNDVFI